jgi:hypothetical protein
MKLSLTPALGFSTAPSSAKPEVPPALLRSRPKGRTRGLAKAVVRPVGPEIEEAIAQAIAHVA